MNVNDIRPIPFEVRPDFVTPDVHSPMDLLVVSTEDAKQMLADIMNPPEPTQALRDLMKGHR